jgi:hypothetical protein
MFEKRMLRRIFGPKIKDESKDWGKLHNELHNIVWRT